LIAVIMEVRCRRCQGGLPRRAKQRQQTDTKVRPVSNEQDLPADSNLSATPDGELSASQPQPLRNRFDRMEWAGAFGDLGTLIPFALAYITVMGLDPLGVLLGFGVCMIATGLWYRTPFPVQPMKALGIVATTQAAQTAMVTPQAVYGAGLVTGVLWLVLGLTGVTRWVTQLVSRPVVVGIVLGLGLAFMLQGIKFMAAGWIVSGAALFVALILLSNRHVPAMFVILVVGALVAIIREPTLLSALVAVQKSASFLQRVRDADV